MDPREGLCSEGGLFIILPRLNAEMEEEEEEFESEFVSGGGEARTAVAGFAASEIELFSTERTLLKIFSFESSVIESIFSNPLRVSSILFTWILYAGSKCWDWKKCGWRKW